MTATTGATATAGERFVRANGVDLCLETFGDPADPTVVLMHGAQASMLWWEEDLCAAIAAGGRHVVRFDTRDTGRSVTYPVGRPGYTMGDLAADVVGILDVLGVDRAHVVGRSMSGGVALFLGVDHRDRVETLTLVTTTSGEDDDLPDPEPEVGGEGPVPAGDDAEALVEHVVRALRICAGRSPYFDEAAARERARRDVARSHDIHAALANHWLMDLGEPSGGWDDLRVPTLVVEGAVDPYFPPPHGAALAARIPGARLLTLADVGHDVPRPAWDVFVPALLTHTATTPAGDAGGT